MGAGLLMGYNFVRFKDPFEIGLRYQLTGPAMQHYDLVTSVKYVFPNLFGYLVRTPLLETDFPFVSAVFITETMWPFYIQIPEYYVYHEPIVGMFTVVPTLFFLVASGNLLLPSAQHHYSIILSKLRWLVYCLAGHLVITAGLLMMLPLIPIYVLNQIGVILPLFVWVIVIIYAGLIWTFGIYLEQMSVGMLYLWHLKWKKKGSKGDLSSVKKPDLFDDIYELN